MSVALLVMTDGRRYVNQAIASAESMLLPNHEVTERYIHDDSGDPANWERLLETFPDYHLIAPEERLGFGGAIGNAWKTLRDISSADYIFHLEDDFTFNCPVPLLDMEKILTVRTNVCQVALRRQPWNYPERRAGGVIEMQPDAYEEHRFLDLAWLEHSLFFTTNPSLYRRRLLELTWPEGDESEGRFGLQLKSEGAIFAYLGERDSAPWVKHIGKKRIGTGY